MSGTMPAELVENLVDFCENRGRVYTLLSRFYEKEVTADFAAEVAAHADIETDDAALFEGFSAIKDELALCDEAQLEQWAVAFNRVFFGMGPRTAQKAFPYESVYTSEGGLMMQEAYAQVMHIYRDANFEKNPEFTEPEDHLAVELSFMARLCDGAVEALQKGDEESAEAALQAQKEFLQKHLLNWVPVFAVDAKKAADGGLYEQLVTVTVAYLLADDKAVAEVLS